PGGGVGGPPALPPPSGRAGALAAGPPASPRSDGHEWSPTVTHGSWKIDPELAVRRRTEGSARTVIVPSKLAALPLSRLPLCCHSRMLNRVVLPVPVAPQTAVATPAATMAPRSRPVVASRAPRST